MPSSLLATALPADPQCAPEERTDQSAPLATPYEQRSAAVCTPPWPPLRALLSLRLDLRQPARVVARRGGVRLHPRTLQPTPLSLLGPLARVPRRVLARRHGLHRRPRRVRRRVATHAEAEPVEASAPASSPTA
eukprot:CAMPEP_0202748372 /NCGR_PEP_ID=MMETSP1388-20130828/9701_1 /ASSEMBLY_ACC=CAM_ASM_000864 /TAXON_ID=37098 /ORGANISM="Isochrysis sp, Strain CCMP1244" /LENGTH=133 /DNA_ID=CAMNT_0049415795 /DNA_START=265 /DNA_END=662 /DNA_ORIENTATION=-